MSILPLFPLQPITFPAYSVHRRPTYATIPQVGRQGRRIEVAQQDAPLWEFELTYDVVRDETQNIIKGQDLQVVGKVELQRLRELYLACGGPYGEFLFFDSTDNSRENQILGTGDGITVAFPFIRTIAGPAGLYFTEQVGAVNLDGEGVDIFIDGLAIPPGPGTWGININLTTLVFTSPIPTGAIVTATFHYYYRCRWISDEQEFEEFVLNFWSAASLKFRSVNPVDPYIQPNPVLPIAPPDIPTPAPTNCLKDFQWWSNTPANMPFTAGGMGSCPGMQSLDKFGNFHLSEVGGHRIYSPSGTTLKNYTQADLADMVDTWYGGPIVVRGNPAVGPVGFSARPIMQGSYVLAFLGILPAPVFAYLANWWVVLEPKVDGTLEVIGARYYLGITGPPYLYPTTILDAANSQTTSDPLLFIGHVSLGGGNAVIGVLPPIDDMSTRSGVLPLYPLMEYNVVMYPIATVELSEGLGTTTDGSHAPWTGFIVPNSAGETLLYCYFNRGYTRHCMTQIGALSDTEVRTVIGPFNPYGSMIKINLGEINYASLSSALLSGDPLPVVPVPTSAFFGGPTPGYSVDNAAWRSTLGAPVIPMMDEWTYISQGNNIGGNDVYEMQPSCITLRPNGKYWINFHMVGLSDYTTNGEGKMYEAFRLFEFDPATEVATQIVWDTCLLASGVDIPPKAADIYQTMGFTDEIDGSVTITIYGCVFKVRFYGFTP